MNPIQIRRRLGLFGFLAYIRHALAQQIEGQTAHRLQPAADRLDARLEFHGAGRSRLGAQPGSHTAAPQVRPTKKAQTFSM